jgi:hypothetical protein
MAKTITLTSVVSKLKENVSNHRTASNLPSEETMRIILGYSRAMQVLQSNITGKTVVILN